MDAMRSMPCVGTLDIVVVAACDSTGDQQGLAKEMALLHTLTTEEKQRLNVRAL